MFVLQIRIRKIIIFVKIGRKKIILVEALESGKGNRKCWICVTLKKAERG